MNDKNNPARIIVRAIVSASLLTVLLQPHIAQACACGCGVFDVATSSMFPQGTGGMVFLEYDYQDQNKNWSGNSPGLTANNPDRNITTSFFTLGTQFMFNRSWGIQGELPIDYRHFVTTGGATGNEIVSNNWGTLGDIRVEGIYTGFSPDLSSGITFGFKLPTGDYTHNDAFGDVDRDTELGTGSTDLLLGGYHRDRLTANFDWFFQLETDFPLLTRNNYAPGLEIDEALGIDYRGFWLGHLRISPLAQIIGSERTTDGGSAASHPVGSGYERIFLSPGLEFHLHPVMLYADAEFPVYQRFTGNQLAAPVLFKLVLSYNF